MATYNSIQSAIVRKVPRLALSPFENSTPPADTPVLHRGRPIPPPAQEDRGSVRAALQRVLSSGLRGAATGIVHTPREAAYDPLLGGIVGGLRGIGSSIEADRRDARQDRLDSLADEDRAHRRSREETQDAYEHGRRLLEFGFDPGELPEEFGPTSRADMVERGKAYQDLRRQEADLLRRERESLIERRRAMLQGGPPRQARPDKAGPKFRQPEEVREAVRSGRLTRQRGMEILRQEFGFE